MDDDLLTRRRSIRDTSPGIRQGDAHPRGVAHSRVGDGEERRFIDLDPMSYAYWANRDIEPGPMPWVPPRRSYRRPAMRILGSTMVIVAFLVVGVGMSAVIGGMTHVAGPRPSVAVVGVHSPAPSPTAPVSSVSPSPSGTTATSEPVREPVDVNIEDHPKSMFISEQKNTWCAAAAVQMALNVLGPDIDVTAAYQKVIRQLQVDYTDREDSRNGGVGPIGMTAALNELGGVVYELRIYDTRSEALFDSARAISATNQPVILLAWRGAHAWVMTGYRADADPTLFDDANVDGGYILDPWYPRVSSIWGPSDPPGTYQDAAEMKRNFLPWKRPEGAYPGRDGKYLVLVPADAP